MKIVNSSELADLQLFIENTKRCVHLIFKAYYFIGNNAFYIAIVGLIK